MPGVRLFVGNLNWAVDTEKLRELFSQYGTVASVRVLEGKGFGFVEMSSTEEAEKARSALKGVDLMGRPLNVEEAKPQKDRGRQG
jgi:RNA recognition motif-containing protein